MAVYVSPLNSQRKDLHIDAIDVNSLLCPLRAHTRIETERAGLACAKARVIRSTAAQLRYALRYAFPKN